MSTLNKTYAPVENFDLQGHTFTVQTITYTWDDAPDQSRTLFNAVNEDGVEVWRETSWLRGDATRAVKNAKVGAAKYLADKAVYPVAKARALDHGRSFGPDRSNGFVPVSREVQVGDDVWVYSYQAWRRGVAEKVGRSGVTVAVVVRSTGNFTRQLAHFDGSKKFADGVDGWVLDAVRGVPVA
jgi:hypothetical protein